MVHDYKYEYNMEQYNLGLNSKIGIICKEHGKFNLKAATHIYGSGCTKCDEYKFNKITKKYLETNNISFHQEHRFIDCNLPFDFYLPKYRTIIEFDGRQHFEPIENFGGLESYNKLKINDKIKSDYCEDNYISLIRIRYDQIDDIYRILWDNLKTHIKK
jgi:very-short-patch-repair endonuclease